MREHEVEAHFTTWAGDRAEVLTLGWEHGGWTLDGRITATPVDGTAVDGIVDRHDDVHYVVRTDAHWRVRQFLLFRDDDEPDLWLASDGEGSWGEVNGAVRDDLTGCSTIHLDVTPVGHTLVLRRHGPGVAVGDRADVLVAAVDVDTLQVQVRRRAFTRISDDTWRVDDRDDDRDDEPSSWASPSPSPVAGADTVRVDADALVVEQHGRFRRHR